MIIVSGKSPSPRRPIHARGIRWSYATMPRWTCRVIAVLAAVLLVFVLLVVERVFVNRFEVSAHRHEPILSFLTSLIVLAVVAWRLVHVTVKAWRFGWSRAPTRANRKLSES